MVQWVLCVWFYLLFSIVGLLSYASYKVINNIQLWEKVYRILIHPPLSVLSICNNWYQRLITQKKFKSLSKIPKDMEQLKKNLEEALEQIDLLIEERDNLKDRCEDAKFIIAKLKEKIDDLKYGKESISSFTLPM